jgi:adenylate cyclase
VTRSNSNHQIYEFGDFRLDPGRRLLLTRDGTSVALTPKVLETLVYLVEHRGTVLEKDQLMRAIWPDTAVEENNLNQSVSTLRRVLGEGRAEHRYIATVPGRGYLFVAKVEVVAAAEDRIRGGADGASVAVLPFLNLSADPSNEYFCEGLAEELINALSKLEQVRVAARTSAFSFKGKRLDVREIGQKLNVNSVLQGSVRKSGNRLRITAQLVNVADGCHVWSERYDRDMRLEDIFEVQDEIALAVVGALKVRLLGKEKSSVLKRHTENPDAYLLYLKGQYYRWKTALEDFAKSCDYFQRAVDADPSFALGYFGLNSFYGYGSAWGLMDPVEAWPKAEAALRKALQLDGSLAEAHLSLAAYELVCRRDSSSAEKEIKRVLNLKPKLPEIHHLYSFYFLTIGRFEQAIAESKQALEDDPFSLIYRRLLGTCLCFVRQYDEAIVQYRDALDLDPNNASLHECLAEAYELSARHSEALAEFKMAAMLAGESEFASAFSQAEFVSKKLDRMIERAKTGRYIPAVEFARVYLRLGQTEEAFCWLERACEERNVYALLISRDPFYDKLRSDRRFENLLQKVGS